MRHPTELGEAEVSAFLSFLAIQRKVSASTQNQALSAILFLYRKVLRIELGWLDDLVHASRPARLPVVLTAARWPPSRKGCAISAGPMSSRTLCTHIVVATGRRLLGAEGRIGIIKSGAAVRSDVHRRCDRHGYAATGRPDNGLYGTVYL